MNTVLEDVLKDICEDVFYIRRQKESVVPAITYLDVSTKDWAGHDGLAGIKTVRYQVTCYSKDQEELDVLVSGVENALMYNDEDFDISIPTETKVPRYDEDTSIYYVSRDYFITF
jgi:hypothetical protein